MSQLDETKESLNTLRVGLSLLVGIIVVIVGGLINRIDNGKIDMVFWIGSGSCFLLVFGIFIVLSRIAKRTKEIKDL